MRSQTSGWWTVNRCNYHLLSCPSLHHTPLLQPRVWKIPSHRHNLPPLRCLISLLTFPLTLDLPSSRVVRPLFQHELRLAIPAWAQNPLRLQRLVVFSATPQAISVSTVRSMNALVVANGLPVIHNTAVSEIIALTADVSPTWLATARTAAAPSATPPTTFLSTVLLRRTLARVSSSTRETRRGFDVVPVVQVFEGGIVTVRGRGLIFSVVHLPPITADSPFTFTILIIFFVDTFRYVVW